LELAAGAELNGTLLDVGTAFDAGVPDEGA
jgi:hypothetical protein